MPDSARGPKSPQRRENMVDLPDRMRPSSEDELEEPGSRHNPIVVGILLLVVVGTAVDLALDDPESWWSVHVLFEVALMAISLGLATWLWLRWWRASRSLAEFRAATAARQQSFEREREEWRAQTRGLLEGLAVAVDRQFDQWRLTATEREVALLLLKGYGHKQIAARTGRSERTVRQHAVAVYQKSGLSGRAELAAFFLEDLGRTGEAP
jgi:DNA-binding CsgD family transcriptional regulator